MSSGGGFPPVRKDFQGLMTDVMDRMTQQERRRGGRALLPARLSTAGQEVTDWDLAVTPGFYWSSLAVNGPAAAGTLVVGVVSVTNSRVVQEVWPATVTDSARVNTFRRVKSGTWSPWVVVGAGFNMGSTAIGAALTPSAFVYGLSYANGDATFPTSNCLIETVRYSDVRAVQRVWEKGDSTSQRWWQRTAIDGATWGRFSVAGADTDWIDLTSYLINGFTATAGDVEGRLSNSEIEIRGSMNAPALTASASAIDFMSGIPTVLRPVKRIGFGTGINSSNQYMFYSRPAGTVAMTRTPAVTAGTTQFTIGYKAN